MALVRAGSGYKPPTKEDYERKKKDIYEKKFNRETERLWNGMIYCKFCHQPKVADFPDRNIIVKCCCQCDDKRYERERRMLLNPPKAAAVKRGEWNPFD